MPPPDPASADLLTRVDLAAWKVLHEGMVGGGGRELPGACRWVSIVVCGVGRAEGVRSVVPERGIVTVNVTIAVQVKAKSYCADAVEVTDDMVAEALRELPRGSLFDDVQGHDIQDVCQI